jgi:cation diffusion facilitator family transporter
MSPGHVTEASAVINILLSFFKIGIGTASGSAALVADGAHSFSDLISDVLCWVSVQLGKRPPDASHPHGYGLYEHVGTLGIASMLVATGAGMTLHSGRVLASMLSGTFVQQQTSLEVASLVTALASVASKELLFHVTYAVGKNHNSPSTVANAYHHRSDALSSLVALVGIGGALKGCLWLDPLAATLVGLMVSKMGLGVAQESMNELSEHMKSRNQFGKLSPA